MADADVEEISIHAPRTGSDRLREKTIAVFGISIHAPRTGSDTAFCPSACTKRPFQSTLPARGATIGAAAYSRKNK